MKAQPCSSQLSWNITKEFFPKIFLKSWGRDIEEMSLHNLYLTSPGWHSPSHIPQFFHLEGGKGLGCPSASVFFIPEPLHLLFPCNCLIYTSCLWLCLLNHHFYSKGMLSLNTGCKALLHPSPTNLQLCCWCQSWRPLHYPLCALSLPLSRLSLRNGVISNTFFARRLHVIQLHAKILLLTEPWSTQKHRWWVALFCACPAGEEDGKRRFFFSLGFGTAAGMPSKLTNSRQGRVLRWYSANLVSILGSDSSTAGMKFSFLAKVLWEQNHVSNCGLLASVGWGTDSGFPALCLKLQQNKVGCLV